MSEPISMIILGVALILMAFFATGVSDSAMPPIRRTEPLTKAHRRTLLVFGVFIAGVGVLRRMGF